MKKFYSFLLIFIFMNLQAYGSEERVHNRFFSVETNMRKHGRYAIERSTQFASENPKLVGGGLLALIIFGGIGAGLGGSAQWTHVTNKVSGWPIDVIYPGCSKTYKDKDGKSHTKSVDCKKTVFYEQTRSIFSFGPLPKLCAQYHDSSTDDDIADLYNRDCATQRALKACKSFDVKEREDGQGLAYVRNCRKKDEPISVNETDIREINDRNYVPHNMSNFFGDHLRGSYIFDNQNNDDAKK